MSKTIRKTFKYRLYPNKAQQEKLQWTIERCRELYNAALDERRSVVKRYIPIQQYGHVLAIHMEEKKNRKGKDIAVYPYSSQALKQISLYEQFRTLTEIKREIRPEYSEINNHILRSALKRVDLAFKAFFRRVKNGEKPGFPRFQGKGRYNSFTTDNFRLKGNYLSFWYEHKDSHKLQSMFGDLKIKLHRPIEGEIKEVTVKQEGGHWYVYFSCVVEVYSQESVTGEMVGIDLGIAHLAALSTGDVIDNPRHLYKSEKKLHEAHKVLARKKLTHHNPNRKGTKNESRRSKARKRVAAIERKIARQRKDFLHKQSRKLVNTYGVIIFEDLQPEKLVHRAKPKQDENGAYLHNGASQKSGLNKSILDAGWGYLMRYCLYKAEWAGRTILFVNPKYTSQICSGCGTVKKKDLSERWHSCECGCELDRDVNAAINILRLGEKQMNHETGVVSAFVPIKAPEEKRQERTAESLISLSLSQHSLWDCA